MEVKQINNIQNDIQHLRWSKGEKYEQSLKSDKEKYHAYTERQVEQEVTVAEEYNKMKCLLFDDGTESCMRVSNKREDANTKLSERCMIENISQNPFLSRNNYLNDLQVQDEFLKPKNSNFNIET
jgi:hypothetical protein